VLTSAAALQIYQSATEITPVIPAPLEERLTSDLPGWTSREVPLAETEEGRSAVESTLQYDDYFSRAFNKGSIEVSLYIAHWMPGKMPPRMVGRHTPDRCWILNGWTCSVRERAVVFQGTQGTLQPAEFGVYDFQDRAKLYVAFWHMVGGEAYGYGPNPLDAVVLATLRDLKTFGFNQKAEQYFIRLSSNVPLAEIWHDNGFQHLLANLEKLNLAEKSSNRSL
jgi:hypothetical protein